VAQILNGVTTYYFLGGAYEVTPSTGSPFSLRELRGDFAGQAGTAVRKYFALGGQMVAMRQ